MGLLAPAASTTVTAPGSVTNVGPPGIAGKAVYDQVLEASPGTWEPAETTYTYTYAWLRDDRVIRDATRRRYRLTLDDLEHRIAVRVTATDEAGESGEATSEETSRVVRAALRNTRVPTVAGTARFTRTVRAAPGRWSTDPTRVRYQWFRSGNPIKGATRPRYRFVPLDVERRVRVQVTAKAPGHSVARQMSPRVAPVGHRVDVRRTVSYHVETRGKLTTSLKVFRRQAQQTFTDPRGWRGAGIRFRPVARGGSFTLVLSAASRVTGFSSGCSSMWSCRVGRYVIINQERWKHASPAWNAARGALRDYRHMVVNHETGHWLGLGHAGCSGQGRAAPVMMQQSKGLGGCRFNPWPTGSELASRYSALVCPHTRRIGPGPHGEHVLREIVVFSGNAHRPLASAICEALGVELSTVALTRFSNDCLQAQLEANCRQRDVYIVQPLVPPTQDHLMELLLMVDAARGASAAQITAVIPYFAYARSDKKDASRISIGGRLVADMLVAAGVDRVLTMTLHAPQVHGFFSVPVDHLTALGVLADHFMGQDPDNTVVVSPDFGNAKTATQFARLLGLPVAAGSKKRLADDQVVIDAIVGDVAGKRAVILDDEIATGGSIVELLDRLAEQGCTEAAVACTHGLFVGKALERLREHPMISEVVTTDTVPPPEDWPALKVRSVANLFAEAIARVHAGESVSSLFDGVDPAHGPPQRRLFD